MRTLLRIAALLAFAAPAMAEQAVPPEQLTPVQQYLYYDTGYAPGYVPPAPEPVQPYDTAYAEEVLEDEAYYANPSHINDGVRGMNLY